MNNKNINKRLKRAVDSCNKSVLDKVINTETVKMEEHDYITKQEVTKKAPVYRKGFTVSFASLMLIFLMFTGWNKIFAIDSIVNIDINPSIEIKISKNNKVLKIKALNKDGEKVIGEIDLKGLEIDTAVNAVLGSMLKNGYINVEKSSILVSVENNNIEKAALMEKNISNTINNCLSEKNVKSKIVSQNSAVEDKLRKEAESYGVSVGKLKLIKEIIALDDDYKVESLAKLSIDDLMKIIKKEKLDLHEKFYYNDDDFDDDDDDDDDDEEDDDGDEEDDDYENDEEDDD